MLDVKTTLGASLLIAALAACGPVTADAEWEAELAQAEAAIVGGTFSPSYKAVFWLMDFEGGGSCTATLIGSRTLLTAAHCADNPNGDYWVTNEDDYSGAFGSTGQPIASKFIQVTAKRIRTGWVSSTGENDHRYDIAMMRLASSPANATPKAWNQQTIDGYDSTSKPLRAVGYGRTSGTGTNNNSQRNQVDLTFEYVEPALVYLGNGTSKGICQGDSGGPSFHTFADGIERVVGVHSFTLQPQNGEFTECTWGADVRVDAHRGFVTQWMTENETATCSQDGLCKTGCSPVDVDCDCKDDGVCSSTCTRPELDPDCPVNCATDGICATGSCGRPDTDCKAVGEACEVVTDCQFRRCIEDSNYPSRYCSNSCSFDSDCTSSMTCQGGICKFRMVPQRELEETCTTGENICSFGLDCVGEEETGTGVCRIRCDDGTVCPDGYACSPSGNGELHCAPAAPVSTGPTKLPRARATYQVSSQNPLSCASVPAGQLALGLLALLGLARRRRAER